MDISGVGQMGNFHWWEGVVEDNLDPAGAGRCKVRVIGHNTLSKTELPTEALPWAYPLLPLNNPHGKLVALKPGTRVMGFYRDGKIGQDLVMLGTVNTGYGNPGNNNGFDESLDPVSLINLAEPVERIPEIGGLDDRVGAGTPIENQPKKIDVVELGDTTNDISDYGVLLVNEINTPRLARGVSEGTITQTHASNLGVLTKTNGEQISEPENPYNAKYPYNSVEESDSGHIREIDDTPGSERIKESHRVGTFYEIHPDGSKVTKVVGDDFSVTIRDKNVKVEGACSIHVVGDVDLNCEGSASVSTGDVLDLTSGGNMTITSGGSLTFDGSTMSFVSGGAVNMTSGDIIVLEDTSARASRDVRDLLQRSGD